MRLWISAAVAGALMLAYDDESMAAQKTGKRSGGGSFSSSRSSSSSSSRSSSSSSSRSSSSSSRSSYSSSSSRSSTTYRSSGSTTSTSGGTSTSTSDYSTTYHGREYSTSSGGSAVCGAVILGGVALFVLLIVLAVVKAARQQAPPAPVEPEPSGGLDVSVVTLAIDWHARRRVQQECSRITEGADTSTNEGLAQMLREVAVVLRRAEASWLYAGVVNRTPDLTPEQAERVFRTATDKAASRYEQELARNVDGKKSETAAQGVSPKATEGEGVVVVTVALAAHRALPDVQDLSDASQIRAVLERFSQMTADDIVATEVILSPAAEEDRMSTAELEMLYPELRKINEASIAGRVACQYCGALFAAELLACPHCGAAMQGPQGAATGA